MRDVALWTLLVFMLSSTTPVVFSACIFAKLGVGDGSTKPADHSELSSRLKGRTLQQSNTTCLLSLGNNTLDFAGCKSLQPAVNADYQLLYTLTLPAGQPGPVLSGAINAASKGWAGFGIPSEAGEMIGASAVIVKACPTCPTGASVDSYFLADYASSAVQPPGKLKVLAMTAQATPAGRLQAYFEIVLTQTADALKSADLDVIYALGELAGEELQAHESSQGVAGTLSLSNAFRTQSPNATAGPPSAANSSTTAPPTAASPAAPAAPAMAPAAAPALPLPAVNSSGSGGNTSSVGGGSVSVEGVPSTTTSSPPPAMTSASSCMLQTAAATSSYSLCEELLSSSAYKLYWSLDTAASPVVLTGAMEGSTDGWLGFGFPAVAGEMPGGNAIIAKPCSTCVTGASVDSYYLGGYSASQVTAPGRLTVPQMNASLESGRLYAQFTMHLTQGAAELAAGVPIIAAQGPVSSSDALLQHAVPSGYVAQSVNFGTGTTAQQESTNSDHYSKVHGILMVVGFGILIPIGVLVARTLKPLDPLWFHLHRIIQVLGLSLGIAGFGLGLRLGDQGGGRHEYDHKAIGITVLAGALVQLLFGVARVQKSSQWRLQWAWFHRLLGVSVVLLAAANVFLGLHIAEPAGTHKFVAGYSAFLAAILALAVLGTAVNEYRARTMKKRPLGLMESSEQASASGQIPSGSYTSHVRRADALCNTGLHSREHT